MDIPLNVEVRCSDGPCGRSTCIILDPVTQQVTHFVVQARGLLHNEYLVPVDRIIDSTSDHIRLRCEQSEVARCTPFVRAEYVAIDEDDLPFIPEAYREQAAMMWPYLITEPYGLNVDVEQIPPHELAIHRGAHVQARDGRVGRVDEFPVNPASGHIAHIVLREGHIWGEKDVTIPISEVQRIEEDVVYLKLDKKSIQNMPDISVKRWRK